MDPVYLDNAATSWPKPERVYRSMDEFMRRKAANPGRAGFRMAVEAGKEIYEARVLLKKFFGCDFPERVVFAFNCTDALNIALKGILRPGDHVITSELEHNSVNRPLSTLEKNGVNLSRVKNCSEGYVSPGEIERLINRHPETRAVVLTHASNVIGSVQPLKEIGKIAADHGVLFVVDAAQTAGIVPIDMKEMNIDVLVSSGHKGLFGPPGTGVLAFNEGVEISSFREGGTGSVGESIVHPADYPERLEAGTPNSVGIVGLKAGVEFILDEGPINIKEWESELMERLLEGLLNIPEVTVYGPKHVQERVGVVSFNIDGWHPQETAVMLESGFKILCRAGLHCSPLAHRWLETFPDGAVRFGISYFNTKEDIDRALEAISSL